MTIYWITADDLKYSWSTTDDHGQLNRCFPRFDHEPLTPLAGTSLKLVEKGDGCQSLDNVGGYNELLSFYLWKMLDTYWYQKCSLWGLGHYLCQRQLDYLDRKNGYMVGSQNSPWLGRYDDLGNSTSYLNKLKQIMGVIIWIMLDIIMSF